MKHEEILEMMSEEFEGNVLCIVVEFVGEPDINVTEYMDEHTFLERFHSDTIEYGNQPMVITSMRAVYEPHGNKKIQVKGFMI
ncbi:MAG: hypothetical protein ACRDCE_17260 [Cetobacterium sp.]|uniref:hypothetical protein n=1 Tax=Cetobacterium sp. TaxID=2071632 RepID=UPI003EE63335